jgi:hypothetical protein
MSSGHLPEFVAEGVRYACRGSRMPRTRVCGYVAYREESDCSKQEDGNSLDYFPVHDQSFTYKSIKRTFPTFRQSVNTGVPRLSRCRRGRCRRQEHQSAIKRVKVSDLEPRVQLFRSERVPTGLGGCREPGFRGISALDGSLTASGGGFYSAERQNSITSVTPVTAFPGAAAPGHSGQGQAPPRWSRADVTPESRTLSRSSAGTSPQGGAGRVLACSGRGVRGGCSRVPAGGCGEGARAFRQGGCGDGAAAAEPGAAMSAWQGFSGLSGA